MLPRARAETTAIPAEHGVDEHTRDGAEQLAVEADARSQLERQRQYPLAQRHGRQHLLDLPPSITRARDYLDEQESEISTELVTDVIANHHVLTRVRARADADVIDAFRRADLVDVSAGLYRAGIDGGFYRELGAAFPFAGFHGVLVRAAAAWFFQHPLRPFPMLRLKAK